MAIENLLSLQPPTKIIDCKGTFCAIDLSVHNSLVAALVSPHDFDSYISEYKNKYNCAALYGGYNEKRNLYQQSDLFSGDAEDRDIHIGIDLWVAAGTSVFAAADGVIHSFNYNAGIGNYGPTIILEHSHEGEKYFTLYGHLAMECIENIEIGDEVKKGTEIATLGDSSVNGNYPPHLHFQIIKDIEGYFGDYPGVCSESQKSKYLENCPDPNLLLKIKIS